MFVLPSLTGKVDPLDAALSLPTRARVYATSRQRQNSVVKTGGTRDSGVGGVSSGVPSAAYEPWDSE